ncbi:MAG TPA: hypothetical protein PKD54_16475, partial [Pirellulaceae bacterium]|nr:hypothetical protein [Pirellulaceae bacterium]
MNVLQVTSRTRRGCTLALPIDLRGYWIWVGLAVLLTASNWGWLAAQDAPIKDDYFSSQAELFERSRRLNASTDLVERDPFDRIYLDEFNKFATLDIVPLLNPPSRPLPREGSLIFDLPEDSLNQYIVPWANVINFKTYNELLLEEADTLVEQQDYARAFRYLMRVHDREGGRNAAVVSRIRRVMTMDAKAAYDRADYEIALSIFEDLYRQDPGLRVEGSNLRSIDLILDCHERAIKKRIETDQFDAARASLASLLDRYGPQARSLVNRINDMMTNLYESEIAQAEVAFQNDQPREARLFALRAREILPER